MNRNNRSIVGLAARAAVLPVLAPLALLAGCDSGEVRVYDAPKSQVAGASAAAASPVMPAAGDAPAAGVPAGVAPAAPAAESEGKAITAGDVKFVAPADWKEDPTPRMMRLTTLKVGEGDKTAEVIVTKLNGPAGGMLENLNRWRGQVGLPPLPSVDEAKIPKVKVDGKDAMLFDMAGPDEKKPAKRQIQVVAPRDAAGTYYIKIIGEASLVEAQKAKFDKMLSTVEFAK